MNSYPFLDNKLQPISDAELGDIVRPARKDRIIDISSSPFVAATELRLKLEHLLMAGELDSGLPILRDGVLTGLIPAPDLEFALDTLGDDEDNTICLMAMDASVAVYDSENEDAVQEDFSRFIDPVSSSSHLLAFLRSLTSIVSDCSGRPLSHRPGLPVLRQAWPALPLRPSGWEVCRSCA